MRFLLASVFSVLLLGACGEVTGPSTPTAVEMPGLVRPYAYPTLSESRHAEVCGDGRGGPACEADEDCRICHDGSACGVPVNVAELEERGPMCQRHDAAECEYAAVRCCAGGCRVTPY